MSATLCWRPVVKNRKTLPDALKFVLRDKRGQGSEKNTYDHSDFPYLRGLVDAEVDGAQELIAAIEQHEEVEVWLEY